MNRQTPFYRNPKGQMILAVVGVTIFYLAITFRQGLLNKEELFVLLFALRRLRLDMVPPALGRMLVDLLLFGILFLGFMGFFAQFVLPLHNLQERTASFLRLVSYTLGRHGPAIFIQNGEVRQRKQEAERRGAGVILLDTASAAVLRTPTRFTRAVGPGTVFTGKLFPSLLFPGPSLEYVAGAVDLHRQTQTIGPKPDDYPYPEQAERETPDEFHLRLERRLETRGLTRDGVEVVPNITVVFQLDSIPGEGHTPFGYRPESVWRAISRQGIEEGQETKSWKWLPAYLAADLWREYLLKFTLNDLFSFSNAQPTNARSPRKTAFETIHQYLYARLTSDLVEELDKVGRPTGVKSPSREFQILQQHGLRVLSVEVTNLRFPKAVEKRLIEQWKSTWLERAREEYDHIKLLQSYEKHTGEETALLEFAQTTSRELGQHLLRLPEDSQERPTLPQTLEYLVRGTLEKCIRDPELHQRLTNEKADLADLIEWIRRN